MKQIKFKGADIHIKGAMPAVGSPAPSFALTDQNLQEIGLDSLGKGKKILNVFVSLDTDVCATSVHKFNDKAKRAGIPVYNISMDLPFAAKRFCKSENLDNVTTLSAFRSNFAEDYGVEINEGPLKGLCARAVFVLSGDNKVLYREVVPEITQEPDYEAALKA